MCEASKSDFRLPFDEESKEELKDNEIAVMFDFSKPSFAKENQKLEKLY